MYEADSEPLATEMKPPLAVDLTTRHSAAHCHALCRLRTIPGSSEADQAGKRQLVWRLLLTDHYSKNHA